MRNKLDIDGRMIHSELVTLLGDSAPCLRTVYRWIERSNTMVEYVEDINRAGRPQQDVVDLI